MRYLLDTHTLLWALYDDKKLDSVVKEMIKNDNNDIYYSIVSPWEIEIKHHKNPKLMSIDGEQLINMLDDKGYIRIDIQAKHLFELKNLKEIENNEHKDPFDRMLLAQAKAEKIALVTHDNKFKIQKY